MDLIIYSKKKGNSSYGYQGRNNQRKTRSHLQDNSKIHQGRRMLLYRRRNKRIKKR